VGGYGAEVAKVAVRRSCPPTFQISKFGTGEKRNPVGEYSVHPPGLYAELQVVVLSTMQRSGVI
jgi:hypothetical protein